MAIKQTMLRIGKKVGIPFGSFIIDGFVFSQRPCFTIICCLLQQNDTFVEE